MSDAYKLLCDVTEVIPGDCYLRLDDMALMVDAVRVYRKAEPGAIHAGEHARALARIEHVWRHLLLRGQIIRVDVGASG